MRLRCHCAREDASSTKSFSASSRRGSARRRHDYVRPADDVRAVFAETAEPLLANLAEADAAPERTLVRLRHPVGIVDVVLGPEVMSGRGCRAMARYRLEGEFSLGAAGGRPVPLRGVADRIDLPAGNRSGSSITSHTRRSQRALQVLVGALRAGTPGGAARCGIWPVDGCLRCLCRQTLARAGDQGRQGRPGFNPCRCARVARHRR